MTRTSTTDFVATGTLVTAAPLQGALVRLSQCWPFRASSSGMTAQRRSPQKKLGAGHRSPLFCLRQTGCIFVIVNCAVLSRPVAYVSCSASSSSGAIDGGTLVKFRALFRRGVAHRSSSLFLCRAASSNTGHRRKVRYRHPLLLCSSVPRLAPVLLRLHTLLPRHFGPASGKFTSPADGEEEGGDNRFESSKFFYDESEQADQ